MRIDNLQRQRLEVLYPFCRTAGPVIRTQGTPGAMALDIHSRTDRLAQLLEERLDIRGAGFQTKLRRAGRLLPRHLRSKGQMLVDAERRADHPRLLRQLDEAALDLAATEIEQYLLKIDPWERRRNIFLNWAASLSFNLIALAALSFAVIWYLGR